MMGITTSGAAAHELSDDELAEVIAHLATTFGAGGSASPRAKQWAITVSLELVCEQSRRSVILNGAEADLAGGHRITTAWAAYTLDTWMAECFCGWTGPERETEEAAVADGGCHLELEGVRLDYL